MPEHCVLTCCLFLEIEGDAQYDLLLLTTENFLPADRGLHAERPAYFGSASSGRRDELHPDRGNLDLQRGVSLNCHVLKTMKYI